MFKQIILRNQQGEIRYSKQSEEYCIHNLIINENWRNKGYGSMMVKWAISFIRKESDLPIFLIAETDELISFYEKLGFICSNTKTREMEYKDDR